MVAMGFTQIHGVDFFDTFASVQISRTFRILLSIYNNDINTNMKHWDIKSAFVNAPLEEEIYAHPVKGFEREGRRQNFKIKKSFVWHETSSTCMAKTPKQHFFFSWSKKK